MIIVINKIIIYRYKNMTQVLHDYCFKIILHLLPWRSAHVFDLRQTIYVRFNPRTGKILNLYVRKLYKIFFSNLMFCSAMIINMYYSRSSKIKKLSKVRYFQMLDEKMMEIFFHSILDCELLYFNHFSVITD